ncbi:MAG TPA: ribosome maturation factor RimP [Gemmatimonadales bacterium]|jgi:ribosome maturation factor RimP
MTDLLEERLVPHVRACVAAMGYELADLRRRGSATRVILQVRIDRPDAAPGRGITVDECAEVSRALEAWLEDSGLVGPRYVLEVSSPGIERPLRWREHWVRFVGRDVRVRLAGIGRVKATIVRVLEDRDAVELRIAGRDEVVNVELANVADATLAVDWGRIERSTSEGT